MASPIVFTDVSKFYQTQRVLKDVSFEIRPKTITVIIGPSGSGKSTLLQLINGLIRPEEGELLVFQKAIDYGSLTALRRRIGYAVQGTGLFPHLTTRKNISLLASLENWSSEKITKRVKYLMNLVNLKPDYLDKYPHQLSGGEQQRVGLCRAMMLNPEIFLLDEPFGALDPITRNEIHDEFVMLQKSEPRSIVLVTHDLREAVKLADIIVVLNSGEIQQIAAPEEVLHKPANDFVARFVRQQLKDDVKYV